jgi:hypothetical protein
MTIRNTKQSWQVGETVKVGFMTLRVVAIELTPGDYLPDAYILVGLGKSADKRYRFVPHNGLERLS